ncbi:MAG: trypsin-like peptidase domain-containing protein [Bdellovibrio sp.]|nr:trypsin-like peptidase domain-containing protein [Bdellovibrio sp.]
MRKHYALVFLGLLSCSPKQELQNILGDSWAVIYGSDTRQEVVLDESVAAAATAMILTADDLLLNKSGKDYVIKSLPLRQQYPLCEDEKFLDQPAVGNCSGVLIAPNKVLTASHCFRATDSCAQSFFIFAWNLKKAQEASLSVSEVFKCKTIISHSLNTKKGIDYAVVELDRPVPGVAPVPIASSQNLKVGEAVVSYSHPLGLPLKRDIGKVLETNSASGFLKVAVDTFNGSSGSPLFNSQGQLIGILSSGMDDFLEDDIYRVQSEGGCINFNRCKTGTCFGESFSKVYDIMPELR